MTSEKKVLPGPIQTGNPATRMSRRAGRSIAKHYAVTRELFPRGLEIPYISGLAFRVKLTLKREFRVARETGAERAHIFGKRQASKWGRCRGGPRGAAILVHCSFGRAHLSGAHLGGADLRRAHLGGADLRRAHLGGRTSSGRTSAGRTSSGRTSAGRASGGRTSAGQMLVTQL